MSLLFPLYALGALALAGPLLFHLFQRKPHGQQEFSSLMFLEASPPQITSRSKLSDLLLLLLRGLALLLLAAAFARPFLRSPSLLALESPTRSVAILIDTSASLRRDGLWKQLQDSIDEVLKDLRPTDQVMLVSYDRKPTSMFTFDAWQEMDASRRIEHLRQQVRALKPTWFRTDFSAAAITASDALLQQRLGEDQSHPLQVVVFTDLQKGSDLEGLQSYQWPEEISVDVRTVSAKLKTNASLRALPPEASDLDSSQVRVLVRNEGDSERGQFQVRWDAENSRSVDVYVPPGQTRVVRVTQPRGANMLELLGDDHPFDNQLYLTETTPRQQKLWYIGDDLASDQRGLFFYLRQSALDTRAREVAIEQLQDLKRLATANPQQIPLCVVTKPLAAEQLADLKRYAQRGGRVLVVLTERQDIASDGTDSQTASFLRELFEVPDIAVRESSTTDAQASSSTSEYAMLADIDFQHPLFQPFADPRFNDFSKIRFWSHRSITTNEEAPWTVVARFEKGVPALLEKQIQDGTLWVLTSGWQPEESQLALSSKFIPLLHGFFGKSQPLQDELATYEVGETIELPSGDKATVVTPGGEIVDVAPESSAFADAIEPGIYRIQQGDDDLQFAVNLASAECQTEPIPRVRLEQLGLRLGKQRSIEALETEQRQMRNKELESKQKLWRWGILLALVLVAIETLLSSRGVSRDPLRQTAGAS